MSAAVLSTQPAHDDLLQLARFYVADLCLAVEIGQIQEIIRDVQVRCVPNARQEISGVFNLRGEVITIIDLRRLLRLTPAKEGLDSCTLIVRSQGEPIGLIVDRVADIHTLTTHSLRPTPPNVGNIEGRYSRAVYATENEIIVIFDLEAALSTLLSESSESAGSI